MGVPAQPSTRVGSAGGGNDSQASCWRAPGRERTCCEMGLCRLRRDKAGGTRAKNRSSSFLSCRAAGSLFWHGGHGDLQWSFLPCCLSLCAAPASPRCSRDLPWSSALALPAPLPASLPAASLPACSGSTASSTSRLRVPTLWAGGEHCHTLAPARDFLAESCMGVCVCSAGPPPFRRLFAAQGCPQP